MKTIILMRHADSYSTDFTSYEHERTLSVTGLLQVERICAAHYPFWKDNDFVLCSALKRTRQTFQSLKSVFPPDINVTFDEHINQMSKSELLDKIQWLPSLYSGVLIIGHNPCLSQFVAALNPAEPSRTLGAAHIVVCTADIADWQDISFNRIEIREDVPTEEEMRNAS